ncbi:MAG: HD domain-containing protein [Methylococcales bacterium]|jgi:5'-deoxynucleotidase|nr:HD domain-containing protein [Methylococcales bacterium]MBT7443725.1 HD domain-containing protein [Methylococcales bacterium]
MSRLSLKDLSRAGHVTRWHTVRTVRQQTLAEHLYLVTVVAQALLAEISAEIPSNSDRWKLASWTLRHDSPELVLGDIPTPMKHLIKQHSEGDVLDIIEAEICSDFKRSKDRVDHTYLEHVAKLADLADAIAFLAVEGTNDHAKVIEEKTHTLFAKRVEHAAEEYPEYQWSKAHGVLNELLNGEDAQISYE